MAKIPLRAYNREIEGLIDQGQTLEAVAHCQHILKTFPKCLDSYRLLGKAYLELQRFTEAADVFNRLLLAVPEDFIANLGMSIIYDDQKNLDAAIWHMERAFETQSSNPAIQAELRRLYSRRDGMEPPKIRLTRGALAQMYARGDQFQQAVSEIKSVLVEEPNRMDLQVLLARVYFRAGQKVEATEICTNLLKKYPYCLDANRILIEILPSTTRAEATQVYRHRVNALDPYSAFAAPSIFNSAEVADAAVSVEKLSYQADAWAPAKFGLETPKEERPPEWLSSKEAAPEEAAAEPTSEENIPEWMKVAGWSATTAAAVEAADRASVGEAEAASAGEVSQGAGEISSGEVPDWLMSMAPPGALEQSEGQDTPSAEITGDDINWLESLGAPLTDTPLDLNDSSPSPISQEGASAMEEVLVAGAAAAAAMAAHKDEPVEETPAEQAEEIPDWLSELGGGQSADATVVDLPPVGQHPTTDWLTEMESQASGDSFPVEQQPAAQANDELPDWLKAPAAETANEIIVDQPQVDSSDNEIPDWLKNAGSNFSESEPVATPPAAEESTSGDMGLPVSEDDAFAWLESLAAKQGAKPEELLTKPEDRPVETPDWLSQISGQEDEEKKSGIGLGGAAIAAGAAVAAGKLFDDQPEEETPAPVEEVSIPEQPSAPEVVTPDQAMSDDDAFSWLESLAAKQGAKPEELLTKPEERADSAPAWAMMGVAAAGALNQDQPEPEPEPVAEEESDLAWLESISNDQSEESSIGDQPIEENLFVEPQAESIFEEKPTEVEPEVEAPVVASASVDEVAEWLQQLDAEEPQAMAPVEAAQQQQPVVTSEELPDWLKEEEPAELPNEELPDWLKVEVVEQSPVVEPVKTEWELEEPPIIAPVEPVPVEAVSEERPTVAKTAKADAAIMGVVSSMINEPEPAKPVKQIKVSSAEKDFVLYESSKVELSRGNLTEATQGYKKLIKKGKMLEEIIFDLREAQYSHPVDVVIWQTLGDAYMRANRLQDALDAYTKAEELLR